MNIVDCTDIVECTDVIECTDTVVRTDMVRCSDTVECTDTDVYEYIAQNKIMIFKREFNGNLEPYLRLVRDIKEIGFWENLEDWGLSCFNQPIYLLPKRLEILKFGMRFNNQITLSKKLKCVIFGGCFKTSFVLSKNIVRIDFGASDIGIDIGIDIGKRVRYIKARFFLKSMSKNLTYLVLSYCDDYYGQKYFYVPETLGTLETNFRCYQLTENFPNGLKRWIAQLYDPKSMYNLPCDLVVRLGRFSDGSYFV